MLRLEEKACIHHETTERLTCSLVFTPDEISAFLLIVRHIFSFIVICDGDADWFLLRLFGKMLFYPLTRLWSRNNPSADRHFLIVSVRVHDLKS